jgi:hypothetical protein
MHDLNREARCGGVAALFLHSGSKLGWVVIFSLSSGWDALCVPTMFVAVSALHPAWALCGGDECLASAQNRITIPRDTQPIAWSLYRRSLRRLSYREISATYSENRTEVLCCVGGIYGCIIEGWAEVGLQLWVRETESVFLYYYLFIIVFICIVCLICLIIIVINKPIAIIITCLSY